MFYEENPKTEKQTSHLSLSLSLSLSAFCCVPFAEKKEEEEDLQGSRSRSRSRSRKDMATAVVNEKKEGAEIVLGHEAALPRAIAMLRDQGLPDGLLPLQDIEEVGYVAQTGYFWVKQKKTTEHLFKLIKTKVSYALEVCGYIEKNKLRKLQGVKAKEFFLWIGITDIYGDDSHPGQTFVKSSAGIGRWHPTEAFFLEQEKK